MKVEDMGAPTPEKNKKYINNLGCVAILPVLQILSDAYDF